MIMTNIRLLGVLAERSFDQTVLIKRAFTSLHRIKNRVELNCKYERPY